MTPSSFFPDPGHMGTLALYRARDEEGLLGAQKPLVGLSMAPLLGTAIMLLTVKKQCGWGQVQLRANQQSYGLSFSLAVCEILRLLEQ